MDVRVGQGGVACCDSWGHKESNTTEQLNWTELKHYLWTWLYGRWVCNVLLLLTSCHTDASDSSSQICIKVKKQQLELDMEQQTGSKLGNEYIKAVYCHPAYLTYMQSTPCKCQAGWSPSWNQDCQEKCQKPQICRWHHPYGRKWS